MDTRNMININTQKKSILGQCFFSLFSNPITQYFLKIPDLFVYECFTKFPLTNQTLKVILEVLKTSTKKKM